MALTETLHSTAFYFRAIGPHENSRCRSERIWLFNFDDVSIGRLYDPIRLHIGSKSAVEIGISVVAEITSIRDVV